MACEKIEKVVKLLLSALCNTMLHDRLITRLMSIRYKSHIEGGVSVIDLNDPSSKYLRSLTHVALSIASGYAERVQLQKFPPQILI